MSYSFEAEPRVVKNKQKYKEPGGEDLLTIGGDVGFEVAVEKKRPLLNEKKLTPLEREEMNVKKERDTKRIEMLKQQLIEYKRGRCKADPYKELQPGKLARIEVDLKYFLEEQGNEPPDELQEHTQTDKLRPRPLTPPYIPQKIGIDATTQIWDHDLFEFDREVEPILHVLISKTIEQSTLEVNEEIELEQITKYKEAFGKRRKEEREDWAEEVKAEVERVKAKNKLLNEYREKSKRLKTAIEKVQCVNIAKCYLKSLTKQSIGFYLERAYWRDDSTDAIQNEFKNWLYDRVEQKCGKKQLKVKEWENMVQTAVVETMTHKKPIDEQRKKKFEKSLKMRMITHPTIRDVRIMFVNLQPPRISPFALKFPKLIHGTLDAWEQDMEEKYQQIYQKFEDGDENAEEIMIEYNESILPMAPHLILEANNFKFLSFAVSNYPFSELPENSKKYHCQIYVFNKEGDILGVAGENQPEFEEQQSFKYERILRDPKMKTGEDEKIIFSLRSLPAHVTQLMLLITETRPSIPAPQWNYDLAQIRVLDDNTNQSILASPLLKLLQSATESEEPQTSPPVEEGETPLLPIYTYIVSRFHRTREGWILEQLNEVVKVEEGKSPKELMELSAELIDRTDVKVIDTQKWEEDLSQIKPSTSVNISKTNKSKAKKIESKSASKKEKDSSVEKKEEEEKVKDKEKEKAQDVMKQTFEEVLKKFKEQSIGPIYLNCEKSVEDLEREINEFIKKECEELYRCCEHGVEIFVNNKLLRKASQILKHSKLLTKFIFKPKTPQIILEEEEEREEGEGEGEGEPEDDNQDQTE